VFGTDHKHLYKGRSEHKEGPYEPFPQSKRPAALRGSAPFPRYIRQAGRSRQFLRLLLQDGNHHDLASMPTHISTVLTLSEDPSILTIWRVVAIVLLFFLMAPILVINNLPMFMLDPFLSFQCAWDEMLSYDRRATLNFSFIAALAHMMVISGYSRAFNMSHRCNMSSSWLVRFIRIHTSSLKATDGSCSPSRSRIKWIENNCSSHAITL
jgi:hypothetical protein